MTFTPRMMPHIAIWRFVVLLLAIGPFAYYVVAIFASFRFFIKERKKTACRNFVRPSAS